MDKKFNMKYKIILKTSYNNSKRVELCLSTWLKNLDYICLTDLLTGKFNEISGSERTDYYSAEEKTVNFINLVKNTNQFDDYDWLVFIDDDAILNIKMFEYILPYLDKNCLYGLKMHGGFGKAPDLIFPSGGAGYFISPSLVKKTNAMVNNDWGVEDVSVGKWINDNKLNFCNYFIIDGVRYELRLNGWFPFDSEKSKEQIKNNIILTVEADQLVDVVENHDEKRIQILRCLTHHYIRTPVFMDYIHKCFTSWKISDLDLFK